MGRAFSPRFYVGTVPGASPQAVMERAFGPWFCAGTIPGCASDWLWSRHLPGLVLTPKHTRKKVSFLSDLFVALWAGLSALGFVPGRYLGLRPRLLWSGPLALGFVRYG